MLLFTSAWGSPGEEKPTFRMLPLSEDCPYLECIFDPSNKVLAVISKIEKKMYTMVPKVDDNGDIVMIKGGKPRPNGKQYKEERRQLESYQEFYIEQPGEIRDFINMFAYNNDPSWSARIDKLMVKDVKAGPGPGQITIDTKNLPKQVDLEESIAEVTAEKMSVVPKD